MNSTVLRSNDLNSNVIDTIKEETIPSENFQSPTEDSGADSQSSQSTPDLVPAEQGAEESGSSVHEQEVQAMDEILAEEKNHSGDHQTDENHEPQPKENDVPTEPSQEAPSEDSTESQKEEAESEPERSDAEVADIQERIDNYDGKKQDPELRLLKTQMAFHKKGQELGKVKRDNEDLGKRNEELQKQIEELKAKVPESEDLPKDVYEKLPEKTKELLEETPGLKELVRALIPSDSQQKISEEVNSKLAERDELERKKQAEQAQITKEDQWVEGVLKEYPDYFEIEQSAGFKKWCRDNSATVESILEPYDDYDPNGGISLRKAYDSHISSTLQKRTQTNKANAAASHINGLSATSPSPASERPKTRKEMEDEAMAEILAGKL